MNVLNNKLICVISIIILINTVYGQNGGNSGGTKEQTYLILSVSYNKSSGYDGDNITIQYILSNVGTKKNQEAINILVPINIPSFLAKPSRKLQVSNDRLTSPDPQNKYIALNTSKVEEASNYKLLLDTNGCLIIDCSKLGPGNNITIYYSTYIIYTGNETKNLFSSGNLRENFDNVRNYSVRSKPFYPQTRPIILYVQDIFYDNEKYYILNNSEIIIDNHMGNAKNKNVSYIYKTKNGKYFTELTSENRINKSGEVYFGIKLYGESPKYNQSIFVVEDLATYHNRVFNLLIYLAIAFASIFLYFLVFIYLITDKKLTRLIKVIVLLILLPLIWFLIIHIPQLYYSDLILLELVISLTSYVIFIKAPNIKILKMKAHESSSGKKMLSVILTSFIISLVFTMAYYLLPVIIAPPPSVSSITALIGTLIGLAGISLQIVTYVFFIVIIYHFYKYIQETTIMKENEWIQDHLKKLFVLGSLFLMLWVYCLKKSFEYPISNDTLYYITSITISIIIIAGLLLTDKDHLQEVITSIYQHKENIIGQITGKTTPSEPGGSGEAPPHEDKKE